MTESAALQRISLAELRSQFRVEQMASWGAVAGVVLLALVFDQPWGLLLGAGIGVMAIVRLPSFAAVDRGDVAAAIWWQAAGTWGVSLMVVAAIPDATPIMILNMIGPLVTGAVYLDDRQMRWLTGGGVVVAVPLGALGFGSGGTGIEDAVPEWLFQIILIAFLASHVVMISASVNTANRVRLATLDEVMAVNEALVLADVDLRESRRRVISAGDRERIRIEKNIHDGAQQRLVALAVQLQLAAQLVRSGTPVVAEHLDELEAESREALDELRELARGIYPSVLTERGLEDALRSIARRSTVPVELVYTGTADVGEEDAAATYFVCLEALQNVAKHAGPDASARVVVDVDDDVLSVSIADDRRDTWDAQHGRPGRSARRRVVGRGRARRRCSHRDGAPAAPVDGGGAVTTRIVVAEDNLLMRRGVVAALIALGDTEVVAECGTKDELLEAVAELAPDVVVTDIRMPPTNTSEGIDAARAIRSASASTAVIVLSQHVEPDYVVSLFDAGSDRLGYLLKENIGNLDELRRAISTVRGGGSSIDPEVVAVMVGRKGVSPIDDLTDRERDVLALIAEGLNNAAIGQRLVIAEKSVQKHINTIFTKLHLSDEVDTHRRVRAVRMWLAAEP